MTKRLFQLGILVLIVCLIFLWARFTGHLGSGIHSGPSLHLSNFLSVHSSAEHWLRVAGKRFSNVAGRKPYFIKINELDAVFFVTEPYGSQMAHFVFLKNGRDVSIEAGRQFDSYSIGMPETSNSWVRVDRVEGPKVFFICGDRDKTTQHEFDLVNQSWTVIK